MTGHGDLSQLRIADLPKPTLPDARHVLVRIRAAALNHLDLWTLEGLPGLSLKFPHILGGDGAGEVEAVGADVRDIRPGDRVLINPGLSCGVCEYCTAGDQPLCVNYRLLGEHVPGTMAEYVAVPAGNVAKVPRPDVSWPEAAAFTLVTLTAWRMMTSRAQVQAGETVLIWGIGGGVSLAALKIAKLAGARAIVTSSSDEKLAKAKALGADIGLNHRNVDVAKEVRALTARKGVDVIVENVGEATWETSLRALGRGGRVVTCGGTSGHRLMTDVRRLFWYQWTIMGSTMGSDSEFREIVRQLGEGQLRPTVDSVFPLQKASDGFRRLESGQQFGKVVVEF